MRPENHDMTDDVHPNPGRVPMAARTVARRTGTLAETAGRLTRPSLLVVGVLLAVYLRIAFWLNPYDADGQPRTMATHTQLGMPPCNFVRDDRQAVPGVRDDDELRPPGSRRHRWPRCGRTGPGR